MRVALVFSAICVLLACGPEEAGNWLSLDRHALLGGEAWRLWTGHLVHFSAMHAAADIALLLVVAAIVESEIGGRATVLVLLIGAPLISVSLTLLVPELAVYKGSSALSALLGFVGVTHIWRRVRRLRFALGCVGLVAIMKTFLDANACLPGFSSLPDGVCVAWQAHLIACLIGAALTRAGVGRPSRYCFISNSASAVVPTRTLPHNRPPISIGMAMSQRISPVSRR